MNMLMILIPVALGLGSLGLWAFLWNLKSGQYEDLEGAACRILDTPEDRGDQDLSSKINDPV
jgi:cbb3-type cytochrome oxidase maturation protein